MPTLTRPRSGLLATAMLAALLVTAPTTGADAATLSTCSVDISASDLGLAIPDASSDGVTVPLISSTTGPVVKVTVTVDITHPYAGDLELQLLHGESTVMLSSHNGGSGDNYTGTTFDDDAAFSVTGGFPPFTGSFIPEVYLNTFFTQESTGTWTFQVADTLPGDTGTLNSVSLHLIYDCSGGDFDEDGVLNGVDNCALVVNPLQENGDADEDGDACDVDFDNDGIANQFDNCVNVFNPEQLDNDGDGEGDECDTDLDGDFIDNDVDNCPMYSNPDQADGDGDGYGDVCDKDLDNDGVFNHQDNCETLVNPDQADADGDGLGNVCDSNDDNDALADSADHCDVLAATTASGCPLKARTLTASYNTTKHGYAGRLYSSALPACHYKRTVVLWQDVPGPDKKIGQVVTTSTGQWVLVRPRVKGYFYARSARVVVNDKGECSQDTKGFRLS